MRLCLHWKSSRSNLTVGSALKITGGGFRQPEKSQTSLLSKDPNTKCHLRFERRDLWNLDGFAGIILLSKHHDYIS